MKSSKRVVQHFVRTSLRTLVSASLCALLVGQPILAETPPALSKAAPLTQLQGQDRVLHALNRLTFGPRPGDVAAVERMGLNTWFERQLNPAAIDDSALDTRLAAYPAMGMPIDALQAKYPSPGILRQMENGRLPLPSDPAARALVTDQLAFYKMQRANAGKAAVPVKAANSSKDAESTAGIGPANDPAMASPISGKRKQKQIQEGMDALEATGDGTAEAQKQLPASAVAPEPMVAAQPFNRMPPEQMQALLALAPSDRFNKVIAMAPEDLIRMRGSLQGAQFPRLTEGMTPVQKETLAALPGSLRLVALESMQSRLDRDIYSDRQLEAVMTDFWLNHFNVYVRKNQNEPYLLGAYERETIRPNALGKFEDLLVATAKSPAMLEYLDNFRSVGPDSPAAMRLQRVQSANSNVKQKSAGLNENYGRELMELHTLGVNGGYTQADVTMVSKVFTGWTIGTIGSAYGNKVGRGSGYVFEERRHEPGAKTVLGRTIQEGGEREGLEVLHMLATSPATAHFICGKLAVRFVSDTPPESLVNRMADSFLKSGGDIKVVLRTMFASPEFWSPAVYRAKVKTPLEFVVSAARASDLDVENPVALVQSLDKLGMPLYGMQTPNGYSWMSSEWVSTGALVSRMNFALVMSDDRMPGTQTAWTRLLGENSGGTAVKPVVYSAEETPGAKEKRLEEILLGMPASERTRATVLSQSSDSEVAAQAATQFDLSNGTMKRYAARSVGQPQKQAGPEDAQAAVMAGLLLGSPEFQKR